MRVRIQRVSVTYHLSRKAKAQNVLLCVLAPDGKPMLKDMSTSLELKRFAVQLSVEVPTISQSSAES